MFTFKSYSWVVGTTSFRVKEINYKIEQQLIALKEIFDENPGKIWKELQEEYYLKLLDKGLISGDAPRKAKDGREKTSGLKDIGLITEDRQITEVGEEILKLLENSEIPEKNEFMIEADALIYLKQLLKFYVRDNEFNIRPFVALLYILDKLDYLTKEEFTYLLPLCRNKKDVKLMTKLIKRHRENKMPVNAIILQFMGRMPNYRNARQYFIEQEKITPELFCDIGINRKSRDYDAVYYDVYNSIYDATKTDNITEVELNNVINRFR